RGTGTGARRASALRPDAGAGDPGRAAAVAVRRRRPRRAPGRDAAAAGRAAACGPAHRHRGVSPRRARHVRVRDRPRRRTALDPPTRWLSAPDGGFHPWCAAAAALRRRHAFNTVARVSEAHPGPGRLVNRVLARRHAWRRPRMRPSALSGLREADGGFDPWCTVAAALRRRHAFNAVARVSEAHPGPGCPGALWMADGGWRTWRGSRMRPSALSGLREARTSRWRGRGDGPGLVALQ